jgi:nucleoside-diphosphate-sugar epimerase
MHLEKRVLVTGGAGFLGSHLCERLLADGALVICVDNFFTGARRNIENLLDHKHFEVIRHDVTFPLYLEVDEIYNLACPASPIHCQHDPVQTAKTSVHGAVNMLGLAKRLRARILQASTSEVYGDPNIQPQPEEYWGHVNPICALSQRARQMPSRPASKATAMREILCPDLTASSRQRLSSVRRAFSSVFNFLSGWRSTRRSNMPS